MNTLAAVFLTSLIGTVGISWFGWLGLAATLCMWLWIIGARFRKRMRDSGESLTDSEPQSSNGLPQSSEERLAFPSMGVLATKAGKSAVLALIVAISFSGGWAARGLIPVARPPLAGKTKHEANPMPGPNSGGIACGPPCAEEK